MKEQYQVKFNIKKPDGFYEYGKTETVSLTVKREKCNHVKAEKILLEKYPDADIVSVTYI